MRLTVVGRVDARRARPHGAPPQRNPPGALSHGRFQGRARWSAAQPLSRRGRGRGGQARLGRPQVLGPERAPAVRSRAAAERRLLAARGLPGPGRLRGRPVRHAPRQRHPVADPDHARRDPGLRRAARARRDHRPARPRGRAQRHHDRDRRAGSPTSGPRPWRCSAATTAPIPAVRYLLDHAGSVYLGGRVQGIEAPTHYDFKHLRDTPQELRDRFRKLGWRRVDRVPDPQPDAPRAPGADLPRRPGGRGQPADPARGRHDQARRRRPLHPRALLREAAAPLSRADHDARACCRWPCAWPARARRSGTRSSARTTAAPT